MKTKRDEGQIQVFLSNRDLARFERLAKKLGMSKSSLGAMMIVDTTNSEVKKKIGESKKMQGRCVTKTHSPENKSNAVYIRMDHRYIDRLAKTLGESTNYKYFLGIYAEKCIKYQLGVFRGMLSTKDGKSGKNMDEYIAKKCKWSGVPKRQMERYYMGKQISGIVSGVKNELEIWNKSEKELFKSK